MTKQLSYFGRNKDLHAERFIKSLSKNFVISEYFGESTWISAAMHSSDVAIISPMTLIFPAIAKLKIPRIIALSLGYDLNEESKSHAVALMNTLNASHEAIVDCQLSYDKLRNLYNYSKPISIVPYGCDFAQFAKISQDSGNRGLLVNRAWTKIHGNEIVLEALENSTDLYFDHITFVGDGPLKKELVSRFASTIDKYNIQIVENVPPESMITMYSQHKFYLSASKSDGTSISLLEAMASSCIAITSDFASNLEWIIPGRNGFVFENGNSEALRSLLQHIPQLLDAALIKEMGRYSRKLVSEKGDWNKNRQHFINSVMACNS